MDYGCFVRQLIECKAGAGGGASCFDRVATAGILHATLPSESLLAASVDNAYRTFGGRVACFLVLTDRGRIEAVAAYRGDAWGITVRREPVVLQDNAIIPARSGTHLPPLLLQDKASVLFQVPCWISRKLMGMQGEAFYPLASPADAVSLVRGWDANAWDVLRVIEACVQRRAESEYVRELGAVGSLHALGAVYVGSIDDTQQEEREALANGIRVAQGPVWWVEDYTIFEPGRHTLVVRWLEDHNIKYMTRRLEVAEGGLRMVDLETRLVSPELCLVDAGARQGLLGAFSTWVDNLMGVSGRPPSPAASSLPYLRQEVLRFYGFGKPATVPTRPWLVQGRPMRPMAAMARLPPRLLYSPDLFLKRGRVPEGKHPSTVLVEVTAKSWHGDPGLELGLLLESRRDRAYRLHFRTDEGVLLPETDELKVFTETLVQDKLVEGSMSLCVLRPRVADGDDASSVVVEFALTTYGDNFTLYCNSSLYDLHLRVMTFEYRNDVAPLACDDLVVPLISNAAKVEAERSNVPLDKALGMVYRKECKLRKPVLWAKRHQGKYRFGHWAGSGITFAGSK
jgi:hypothetical protein